MKIVNWNDFIDKDFYISSPSAVTVGVFDGMHLGHRFLINKLFTAKSVEKVVFTFIQNPAWFYHKENYPGDIYTLAQKIESLKMTGVTTAVLIDFSSDFSKLTGNYFISCIRKHLNLVKMVSGSDFKCGNNNDTTATDLAEIYFRGTDIFEIVNRQSFYGFSVSSTAIRELIKKGEIDKAFEYLEFGHAVDLNNTEIFQDDKYCYIYKNAIRQVLPDAGKYNMSILNSDKTFKTEVIIDKNNFKWLKTAD
ncbi:MAG: FAD synthetase family protein [Spirochaetia bacterium]|jgi:FAD synthase|nr:FAD synthetase family protein [Spirochaetia bacterium]